MSSLAVQTWIGHYSSPFTRLTLELMVWQRLLGRISKYTGDKSLKSQSYGVTGGKMNMGQTYGNQYNLNSTHPGGQQSTYTAPSLGGRPFF